MTTDALALLAAVALLAGNAFFVGAEFALISARRDRLETLAAAAGRTAGRARPDRAARLRASCPGCSRRPSSRITVCSLLLGRLGEPAVAHLRGAAARRWSGCRRPPRRRSAFAVALLLVVVAHMLLGEMVPRNIAIAGPERAAMLLVPAVPAVHHRGAPGRLRCSTGSPRRRAAAPAGPASRRAGGRVHLRRARRDDRRVAAGGPARRRRVRPAHPHPHGRRRHGLPTSSSPETSWCRCRPQPRVGDVTAAVAATGFSRFPVRSPGDDATWIGYLHVKDVLDLLDRADGADAAPVPPQRVRGLPEVADARPARRRRRRPARLPRPPRPRRRPRRHAPSASSPSRTWSRSFVGTVRDATHRQGVTGRCVRVGRVAVDRSPTEVVDRLTSTRRG